jgi:exodeoxyribonuclease VII small subunit
MNDPATGSADPGVTSGAASGPPPVEALSFDAALAELQEVVARLESGALPLEEAIAAFERGVRLHDRCAALLDRAELRVQRLVEETGGALRTIDFGSEDANGPEGADGADGVNGVNRTTGGG